MGKTTHVLAFIVNINNKEGIVSGILLHCVYSYTLDQIHYSKLCQVKKEKSRTSVFLLYMSSDLSQVMLLDFISSVLFNSYTQHGAHITHISGYGEGSIVISRGETHPLR